MAPLAHINLRDSTPALRNDQDEPQQPSATWIVAPIVVGVVLLVAVVVFVLFVVMRRLRRGQQQRQQVDAALNTYTPGKSRRSISGLDRLSEEEEQRTMIIRKSLAERSSKSSAHSRRYTSISSLASMLPPSIQDKAGAVDDEPDTDDDRDEDLTANKRSSAGLRDDWKEFEARIQRERSNSGEVHPATAIASPYGDPPLPVMTRSRSSSQASLLNQGLPSHPASTIAASQPSDWSRYAAAPRGGRNERPKSEIPGIAVHGSE